MHAFSADLGPTMSAGHSVEATVLASGPAGAASVSYAGQEWEPSAVEAAHGPERTGGHSGLAMCLAVLSLLVFVVLRWRGRAVRTVPMLTRTLAAALAYLVRGPPPLRTPSLSELCICRT